MELEAHLPFGLSTYSSQKVSLIIFVQEHMKLAACLDLHLVSKRKITICFNTIFGNDRGQEEAETEQACHGTEQLHTLA